MMGRVNSIQSLGTVDGPGVRFVVFFQGCNLRCKCCHNPDTWASSSAFEMTVGEVMDKAMRFRDYWGEEGGITLSGGEPMVQAQFAASLFEQADECVAIAKAHPLADFAYAAVAHMQQFAGGNIQMGRRFVQNINRLAGSQL